MKHAALPAMLVLVSAAMGAACIVGPYVLVHGTTGEYTSPLFPLLRNAVENLAPAPTAALLVLTGAALGLACPRHWFVLGASTALLLPIAAMLEMAVDPHSHKLWPLEFLLYLVFVAGPGVLGAMVGGKWKWAASALADPPAKPRP